MIIFSSGLMGLGRVITAIGFFYAGLFLLASILTVFYLCSKRRGFRFAFYTFPLLLVILFTITGHWEMAFSEEDWADLFFWATHFSYFSAIWISAAPLLSRWMTENKKSGRTHNSLDVNEMSGSGRAGGRFSLGQLLVAVTLVALVFGLLISAEWVRYFLYLFIVPASLVATPAAILAERAKAPASHVIAGAFAGSFTVCLLATLQVPELLYMYVVDTPGNGAMVALVAAVVGAAIAPSLVKVIQAPKENAAGGAVAGDNSPDTGESAIM